MNNTCAVILAAGEGKRMKSIRPKAVCEILFKPMISYVVDACKDAGISEICVVVGEGREMIEKILPEEIETVFQEETKGTSNALFTAREFIEKSSCSDVLSVCADSPFITGEDLKGALERHRLTESDMTILSGISQNLDNGHGRILRDHGIFRGIVEEKDANTAQKQITEINTGCYIFKKDFALSYTKKLEDIKEKEEKSLSYLASLGLLDGKTVVPFKSKNPNISLGANTRAQLFEISEIARKAVIEKLMDEGVSFAGVDGVIIGKDVKIGRDTLIYPNVIIKGQSKIGCGCEITSGTIIEDSVIGDECLVRSSFIEKSVMGDFVTFGPYSHLRPNCEISNRVKIGNFVEVKNSKIGEKSSIAHLSYIGDTDMGSGVNVGCQTSTANYDGFRKFRSEIGDDCFIGCHTSLISPVKLGRGAFTAAGSVITRDIPEDSLGVSRTRQENKEGWAKRYNQRNEAYKKKK